MTACLGASLSIGAVVLGAGAVRATPAPGVPIEDHEFRTSDGVRLHYLSAGQGEPALVVIPGWLMPARLFERQLTGLSAGRRVVVLDPRSQGDSELAHGSHSAERRSRDIAEFVAELSPHRFVLMGWSLGVMEGLDYVERYHPEGLAGLVLIDNSIGEARPPAASATGASKRTHRLERLRAFVRGLFAQSPPPALLSATEASVLRVPDPVAAELLAKPYPREYYRDALYRADVPVMYAIRPKFAEQGDALKSRRPDAWIALYPQAGHALFVDEAERFNRDVESFLGPVR